MTTLLALGMINLGHGLYIPAKAALAQHLVQRAWQRGEVPNGKKHESIRPWPWADTYPIARLTSDAADEELFILSGGSGRTLAFGPGHLQSTALPGDSGNSVIIGHRDTHFRFLADLDYGDLLVIDRQDGERIMFEVTALEVVDASRATLELDDDDPRLTLITCYPFDAIRPGGPMRYVVSALPVGRPTLAPDATTAF